MKIGIIAAMEEELRVLSESIHTTRVVERHGFKFIEGTLSNKSVVIVQSGIGKVNATICATLLIQLFDISLVINTGSAGGFAKGISIGDVVIATDLLYHDVDVTFFGYEKGQMAGMPATYAPHSAYSEIAYQVGEQLGFTMHRGQIVSADSFVNGGETIQLIRHTFPKAVACEMESTAIAQTCHVMGVDYVIVRAISDSANDEASMTFDEFILLAGKNSAQLVIQLLSNIHDEEVAK